LRGGKKSVWLKRRTRTWAMTSVWEKIIKACTDAKKVKFGELRLILTCGRRTTGRQSVHQASIVREMNGCTSAGLLFNPIFIFTNFN
jgi:hypothetical protein